MAPENISKEEGGAGVYSAEYAICIMPELVKNIVVKFIDLKIGPFVGKRRLKKSGKE